MAILGLLPKTATITGAIIFRGERAARPEREASCSDVRGDKIAMVFQDALAALNPVFTGRRPDRRGDRGPRRDVDERRAARPRARAARHRRHPEPERARRPVPARVLRRHAPAGDDRDVDRQRPRRAHRRRADDRARRDDPGPGARGARAHPGPHAVVDHPDHPRPRRGRRRRRPGAGDVRRPAGRARRASTRSSTSPRHPYTRGLLASLPRLDRRRDDEPAATASRGSRRR